VERLADERRRLTAEPQNMGDDIAGEHTAKAEEAIQEVASKGF
jgi:hypothetical protein